MVPVEQGTGSGEGEAPALEGTTKRRADEVHPSHICKSEATELLQPESKVRSLQLLLRLVSCTSWCAVSITAL